jgi:patatin-like phospholipase/acyl hydrolase
VVFRSWEPSHASIPLVQILDATSAVPVLFPPVTINQQQYMDGATITNSPISIAHLVGLCRYPQDNISLLSIGTINPPVSKIEQNRKFANSDMGIVQLVALGLPLKIVRQSGFVNNQLSIAILGTRFLRIEGIITGRTDDVATCTECVEVARSVWAKSAQAITDFLLQTNPSTTAELGGLVSSDPLDRPTTQGGDPP